MRSFEHLPEDSGCTCGCQNRGSRRGEVKLFPHVPQSWFISCSCGWTSKVVYRITMAEAKIEWQEHVQSWVETHEQAAVAAALKNVAHRFELLSWKLKTNQEAADCVRALQHEENK